ncbi:unnamed protein product [Acanthoscelides obtectus]|uniref:Uncharacterized protein n=1 Tax=Acanthoscelides obtectus TaxID=200917 RepID=A0A9P0L5A0_ACAOB|nr:unnamed protein product [Acanthoscelides obtectus]CAK1687781.1 hypothetical protein AOBTE_LOCUS36362 [Acanthoscelides obtectus]
MAEYPPRMCGPCPHAAHFEDTEADHYFSRNQNPEPHVRFHEATNLNEQNIGVTSANLSPDLRVSPVKGQGGSGTEGKYLGGIPPCQDDKPINDCSNSCLNASEPESKACACCSGRQEERAALKGLLKKVALKSNIHITRMF